MKVGDKVFIDEGATPEAIRAAQYLHVQLNKDLERIAKRFKPGAKITLVVRHPDRPDGSSNVVLSDDDLDETIAELQRAKVREGSS